MIQSLVIQEWHVPGTNSERCVPQFRTSVMIPGEVYENPTTQSKAADSLRRIGEESDSDLFHQVDKVAGGDYNFSLYAYDKDVTQTAAESILGSFGLEYRLCEPILLEDPTKV